MPAIRRSRASEPSPHTPKLRKRARSPHYRGSSKIGVDSAEDVACARARASKKRTPSRGSVDRSSRDPYAPNDSEAKPTNGESPPPPVFKHRLFAKPRRKRKARESSSTSRRNGVASSPRDTNGEVAAVETVLSPKDLSESRELSGSSHLLGTEVNWSICPASKDSVFRVVSGPYTGFCGTSQRAYCFVRRQERLTLSGSHRVAGKFVGDEEGNRVVLESLDGRVCSVRRFVVQELQPKDLQSQRPRTSAKDVVNEVEDVFLRALETSCRWLSGEDARRQRVQLSLVDDDTAQLSSLELEQFNGESLAYRLASNEFRIVKKERQTES